MSTVYFIVIISTLGTLIGSLIGVLKKPSDTFMYNLLSFAAGTMLSLSFLSLIPHSIQLSNPYICIMGVAVGSVVMFCIDKLIPHIHPGLFEQEQGKSINKLAIYLIIGICFHHFPEGMAIAIGTVTDFKISVAVALAIALHDIPEGICTAAPYYAHSNNRLKAFLISSATAVPTILGFFISFYLYQIISIVAVGFILGATAGLMIYICADELIPSSSFKLTNHSTIFSFIAGIILVIFINSL